jgi:hypothetical protein
MKRLTLSGLLLLLLLNFVPIADAITHAGAKIYLAPQGGFETYLNFVYPRETRLATAASFLSRFVRFPYKLSNCSISFLA